MNEHTGTGGHAAAGPQPQPGPIRLAGALGIAASIIGLLIFLVGCLGFEAVFALSILPLVLGGVGLVITIVGGFMHPQLTVQDMGVVAALFVNLMGLIGGVVLLAVWQEWTILPGAAGM